MVNHILYVLRKYLQKELSPFIEKVSILLGRFIGILFIPFFRSKFFFFFPFYHIGGAEKIHLKIVQCLREANPIVFFTNKSESKALKKQFMENAKIFDISRFIKPGFLVYFISFNIWVGILSTVINSNKNSTVFGCNSFLFYKMIPYLKAHIYCIDLVHAFGGGIEDFSLPYVERLNKRVVINKRTLNDFKNLYQLNGISEEMNKRIFLISNCVKIPERIRKENNGATLRILYVGRGSEEKRVHLIGTLSDLCYQDNIPVEFILVGDVKDSINQAHRKYCKFLGELEDENEISEIYNSSDILLLVSSREGFPLAIMEAMAHGVVVISTDVGGIPEHISNGYNGFLIKNESEELIVENTYGFIIELASNKALMNQVSLEAYEYAKENFNCGNFCSEYRKLILNK